ncbi:hypothetical protein GGR50DRAFT_699032 [Xylaria sp. CBS 124048]|nr:hypothetical protein GGR50DRAFT_699032 [Xylaria sp. CBS 124048]
MLGSLATSPRSRNTATVLIDPSQSRNLCNLATASYFATALQPRHGDVTASITLATITQLRPQSCNSGRKLATSATILQRGYNFAILPRSQLPRRSLVTALQPRHGLVTALQPRYGFAASLRFCNLCSLATAPVAMALWSCYNFATQATVWQPQS